MTDGHVEKARRSLVSAQGLLFPPKMDQLMDDVLKARRLVQDAGDTYSAITDGLREIYGDLDLVKRKLDHWQRYVQLAEANLNAAGQGPG